MTIGTLVTSFTGRRQNDVDLSGFNPTSNQPSLPTYSDPVPKWSKLIFTRHHDRYFNEIIQHENNALLVKYRTNCLKAGNAEGLFLLFCCLIFVGITYVINFQIKNEIILHITRMVVITVLVCIMIYRMLMLDRRVKMVKLMEMEISHTQSQSTGWRHQNSSQTTIPSYQNALQTPPLYEQPPKSEMTQSAGTPTIVAPPPAARTQPTGLSMV